jgi:hypothetical protein
LRSTAQSVFLKGYFVDNTGQKSECYIHPENWKYDTYLSYRLHLLDSLNQRPVNQLREFGIYSKAKYILSGIELHHPEDKPDNPEWTDKNVLLNVVVEGRNSLYSSLFGSSVYFFSREATGPIVFLSPRAITSDSTVGAFQEFLFQQFNCRNNQSEYFHSLKYDATSLSGHFLANNRCLGLEGISYPGLSSMMRLPEADKVRSEPVQSVSERSTLSENSSPEAKPAEKPNWHYVSVEINPLLRQILNFSDEPTPTNNPFQFQYASNSKLTGKGLAAAFSYSRFKLSDNSNGNDFETITREMAIRIGYERKLQAGNRWIYLYGFDFLILGGKDETTLSDFGSPITITTKQSGWGMGPRAGIMFQLASQVVIGTETSLYYTSVVRTEKFPGSPDAKQRRRTIELTLPVAILLGIRLGR